MTLTSKEKYRRNFWKYYLKFPILLDIFLSFVVVGIVFLVGKYMPFFDITSTSSLSDILNELISSTLSAGGFVLAAIAILASIKESVKPLKKEERAETGSDFFFNSKGYQGIIKVYANCAIVFLCLFIYFSVLRSIAESISISKLFWNLLFGSSLLVITFLRTISLLRKLVTLR